jgi:hypothetical protein
VTDATQPKEPARTLRRDLGFATFAILLVGLGLLTFPRSSCDLTLFRSSFESHPSRKPFQSLNFSRTVSRQPHPLEILTSYSRNIVPFMVLCLLNLTLQSVLPIRPRMRILSDHRESKDHRPSPLSPRAVSPWQSLLRLRLRELCALCGLCVNSDSSLRLSTFNFQLSTSPPVTNDPLLAGGTLSGVN